MAKEAFFMGDANVVNPAKAAAVAVVLVAHAPLGSALKAVSEHVFGEPVDLLVIDMAPGACAADSTHGLVEQLLNANRGAGVLLLTDLPGASPANICQDASQQLRERNIPCLIVTGLNASMVLRVLNYRSQNLDTLCQHAIAGGTQTVKQID
jgi:mannose PTS system EIIA component|uniref:PTS sugar transporter subunit IIA n=1 Tax=Orrella sp. TaxID=1921583 RepID=UPI004047D50C